MNSVANAMCSSVELVPVQKWPFSGRLPAALKIMLDDPEDIARAGGAEVKRPSGSWALCKQAKPTPLLPAAQRKGKGLRAQLSRWRAKTKRLKLRIEPQT